MNKDAGLEKVTDLTLYTGTYGKEKCSCNCIGCTQDGYIRGKKPYQGTIEQIRTIIEKLPNLQNAYLLGNPDVSVDTEFCNIAAKEFIKNNIKVMFSSSGFNAYSVIKKLTDGLDLNYISYISYSIDTIDREKMCYLKGTNKLDLAKIDKAINYCIEMGIPVKIQPTLWEINQKDYKDIINYYYDKFGIRWFTFHAGSFESLKNKKIPLNHVKPKEWKNIVKDIEKIAKEKNLKIVLPRIFLNQEEMNLCQKNIHTYCANGGTGLQIWLEKDEIRCTYCPLLAEVHPEFTFEIHEKEANFIGENGVCTICKDTLDNKLIEESNDRCGSVFNTADGNLYNVCRFYSIRGQF